MQQDRRGNGFSMWSSDYYAIFWRLMFLSLFVTLASTFYLQMLLSPEFVQHPISQWSMDEHNNNRGLGSSTQVAATLQESRTQKTNVQTRNASTTDSISVVEQQTTEKGLASTNKKPPKKKTDKKAPVMSQSDKYSADFAEKVRMGLKVPHILHRTAQDFGQLSARHKAFHVECKEIYNADGWEVREWNDEDIDQFVREHFADRYDKFRAMEPLIRRVDAVRYLWMYKFGGIYLDMDGECIRPASELIDALPEGSTAWSGGYPEPFFMMSTAGNEFWLYAFEAILRDWKKYNVRSTGGPQGLNRMFQAYISQFGIDAVRLFALNNVKAAESVYPPGDVTPFDPTWRYFVAPHQLVNVTDSNVPVQHKIGFIPNGIVDPTACKARIGPCHDSHCHEAIKEPFVQQALFVGKHGVASKRHNRKQTMPANIILRTRSSWQTFEEQVL